MKNLLLFILVNFLVCLTANASPTNYVKITEIKAFGSQAYIYVEGLNDSNNCGSTALSSMVRFYWSTANVDKLWSILLAAQMAGKEVAFDGSCVSNYLSINTVNIKS